MQKEDKVCNITPANRVGSVQEYYFSKKLKEVAEMNAAGKNVINLGVGSPDLPPSEQTIETVGILAYRTVCARLSAVRRHTGTA